ncbi:hypothetical protein MMC24_003308 [Lignoscripta atroalba]|nr:hypothetical protein [Lignoscripta atroalba]
MASPKFSTQPPPTLLTRISCPKPHVLLVTLSRPKSLNCINTAGHEELSAIWDWLDNEPSLRIGIITEWDTANASSSPRGIHPPSGFGGLSQRTGKKPVIAAVNGICFGGGCEMIINTDIVLASSSATFALPEVKRGVVAIAGALPRLVRTVGRQRAMEMALTGRVLKAEEAREWGLCNKVVVDGDVVGEAVRWAEDIASNSPDSVIVSRAGVKMGWEGCGVQEGTERLKEGVYGRIVGGENMREGVKAFVEKRGPREITTKKSKQASWSKDPYACTPPKDPP